jgi:hypothetical protein
MARISAAATNPSANGQKPPDFSSFGGRLQTLVGQSFHATSL